MARPRQRTFVDRLADAGEEAIQRLGTAPGGERMVGALNAMRDRMDDMQKQLRAVATIEKRLSSIERRLDALEGKGGRAPARKTTTSRKTSSSTPKTGSS
jgi:hypothetical protein